MVGTAAPPRHVVTLAGLPWRWDNDLWTRVVNPHWPIPRTTIDSWREKFGRTTLVPRLCLGTHCPGGSASLCRSSVAPPSFAAIVLIPEQAEPARHPIPRQSLGTRIHAPETAANGRCPAPRP